MDMNQTRMMCAAAAMSLCGVALAQNVGVAVTAGQPGFYGRIDIGGVPQPPRLVYAQPIVIEPARVAYAQPPLYLRVPRGHAKNWRKHCARYNACGQPVYFVQERWVRERYEERQHPGRGKGHDKGHGKGHKD